MAYLAIRLLGLPLLEIHTGDETPADDEGSYEHEAGDCTSTAVGFNPTPGDMRWEPGTEYQ